MYTLEMEYWFEGVPEDKVHQIRQEIEDAIAQVIEAHGLPAAGQATVKEEAVEEAPA